MTFPKYKNSAKQSLEFFLPEKFKKFLFQNLTKGQSSSLLGGHGHELYGHRCLRPCHGHGHGRGHEKIENRDTDMDTDFLKKP